MLPASFRSLTQMLAGRRRAAQGTGATTSGILTLTT